MYNKDFILHFFINVEKYILQILRPNVNLLINYKLLKITIFPFKSTVQRLHFLISTTLVPHYNHARSKYIYSLLMQYFPQIILKYIRKITKNHNLKKKNSLKILINFFTGFPDFHQKISKIELQIPRNVLYRIFLKIFLQFLIFPWKSREISTKTCTKFIQKVISYFFEIFF